MSVVGVIGVVDCFFNRVRGRYGHSWAEQLFTGNLHLRLHVSNYGCSMKSALPLAAHNNSRAVGNCLPDPGLNARGIALTDHWTHPGILIERISCPDRLHLRF